MNCQHECSNCKKKQRDEKETRDLMNRLSRIEGQVRGIKSMVGEDRYCVDILTQVSAIQSALNSFNKVLLSSHIKTCVVEEIQSGNEEVVDELCKLIQKLMK
ncbi:MAG: metal-sensing transcriptional repressor [Firmicutes bacterium]|uniref:Metal-sensing transcriptional repressor n=1 Tax=Candidatus Scybalomonas excrementavium TaxID=2840943 RepID=A0A9D9I0U4_9FIRM|nr:metal-sensing transcriptional repressor [Candidatus Scybalomonas excrementavium]